MPKRDPAPGPLATVQAFVNTLDLEDGPELLADAEGAAHVARPMPRCSTATPR